MSALLPNLPATGVLDSMPLSPKEILQEQAKIRMDELRVIGANINYSKDQKDTKAVEREEQEYKLAEQRMYTTLAKIQELTA